MNLSILDLGMNWNKSAFESIVLTKDSLELSIYKLSFVENNVYRKKKSSHPKHNKINIFEINNQKCHIQDINEITLFTAWF